MKNLTFSFIEKVFYRALYKNLYKFPFYHRNSMIICSKETKSKVI